MKRISGLKDDLVPKILDKSLIDEIITVDDDKAYKTAIEMARKNGFLVGPTTGAIAYTALEFAKKHKGTAVIISPDDAFKYPSFFAPYVTGEKKQSMDKVVDLKGEICPLTFVKSKLVLEGMKSGQILEVIVDHEPAIENVPRSMKNEGHEVIEVKKIGKSEWKILVRKK